jgi:hypothetical protein
MTLRRGLAPVECAADDMDHDGQLPFRDGGPKTGSRGSLELWTVRSRSSFFQLDPARLVRLILLIRQQGSRFKVSRFRIRIEHCTP